ncbi:hypothetical protein ABPG75_011706 [Micractinium tetrahymenae]
MDSRTVEVVLAVPSGLDTSDDAAIASALQDEEDSLSRHPAAGQHDRDSPPSAPPLPESSEVVVVSCSSGGGDADGSSALEAVARHDEQLARELQEEELQQLSGEERARLTDLPGMLIESPLVRTLSEKLSSLAGVSVAKLVPRVNPSEATAAAEAAAAAAAEPTGRALLERRLKLYCLTERVVKGDGACQFRSLSDQLYRTPRLHAFVRQVVCQQLRAHPEWYRDHVPGDYRRYVADMARTNTWGDHVTLQAAADAFGLRIMVLTSFESADFLDIEPRQLKSSRVLLLSFFAEVHYNSAYSADEPPPPLPAEKLLGSRRLWALLLGP